MSLPSLTVGRLDITVNLVVSREVVESEQYLVHDVRDVVLGERLALLLDLETTTPEREEASKQHQAQWVSGDSRGRSDQMTEQI